jgi:hypothetical protein
MNAAFRPLYEACVACVKALCELNPPADSPEGQLLLGLGAAVEEYERTELPPTEPGST